MLRTVRQPGEVTWHATIMVGVGEDEAVDQVGWRECESLRAAQAWINQHLPAAKLPDWAPNYPHSGGGVYTWGWIQSGFYSYGGEPVGSELEWEPDFDVASLDGDLVDGQVRWRQS